MKPFFKNFSGFFVLFLAAFLLIETTPTLSSPKSGGILVGVVQAIPKVNQANLVQACLRGNKIICRGITKKTDDQSNKFTEVEIHGKKYTLTNYSERNIFLPMNSVEEWERVICASSQRLRNKVDCTQWTVAGFPHENGREAADPFDGKDLSTFEYEKSTGPSLGIKIDLIAEWLVTQARGCPTSCGNSARNFSGSVRCSTGNDADCTDPKPAIPTRTCGKTRDCTTGRYSFGSCPSHSGYGGGYIYGTCNYDSCTGNSIIKYCSAVTPTYTGTWVEGTWGSCNNSCGNGEQTRTVTCSGGNCNPSTKPYEKQNCSDDSGCVVNCPANPPSNASWLAGHGNTQPNCEWSCNATFEKSGNSCVCPANTVQVGNSCEPVITCQWSDWNWGNWSTCSTSCDGGNKTRIATRYEAVPAQNGGAACTGSDKKSETVNCNTQACPPTCSGGRTWNGSSCVCPADEEWDAEDKICRETEAVNCQWSAWSSWSSWGSCSKSCGGGTKSRTRTRTVAVSAQYGGAACSGGTTETEKQSCNTQACLSLYECNGYGSWIKKGTCSQQDYCDHSHYLGDTCCTPSVPTGQCIMHIN